MSELAIPVSAARGASFEGPDATIRDLGPTGMITIRGDLSAAAFKKALKSATGLAVPALRKVATGGGKSLVWMSPDELLIVCNYAESAAMVAAVSEAMGDAHHLAVDVSDARCVFAVSGEGARELIAKGAPVDMSPEAFGLGDIRRTRLGQVAAAFWMDDAGDLTLVCFRSLGQYVFDWLKASAADGARPRLF
ncbi:MAG: sarcosine oxidase subunit gamma family protein [Pseudomonadota bacterium]